MILLDCYSLLMTSTDGIIADIERMGSEDPPRMLREHARFLIVTLYGAILALVRGSSDLASISLACQVFEGLHRPRVEEAACLGFRRGERLDTYLESLYERYGEDAVLEATELQEEKAYAHRWMLNLRDAFREVVNRPEVERTPGNVRAAFLQLTQEANSFSDRTPSKDPPHKIADLEVTYRTLTSS